MNKKLRTIICKSLLVIIPVVIVFTCYYFTHKEIKQTQLQEQVKIQTESQTKLQIEKQAEEIKKYRTKIVTSQEILVNYVIKHSSPWVSHKHVGLPRSIANKIVLASEKCKRPLLILAIAQVESHFNPMAHSSSSVGICQINLVNVKELKKQGIIVDSSELLCVDKNMLAADYFITKLEKGRDLHKALQLYFGKCKTCKLYSSKVLQSLGDICLSIQ